MDLPKRLSAIAPNLKGTVPMTAENIPFRHRKIERSDHAAVIEEYLSGLSAKAVGRQRGVSHTIVLRILREHGVQRRKQIQPPEVQAALVRDYQAGMGSLQIAAKHGVNFKAVFAALRRASISARSVGKAIRTCSLNEAAFDIITEEAAYWIGFLMADGCITDRGHSTYINLMLASKDAGHVEAFQRFLGSNHKIGLEKARGFAGSTGGSKLSVASKRLAAILARYGVVPRKSHTTKVIGLEHNRDFWRGVVDGDGWVSIQHPKTLRHAKPCVGLTGSLELLTQFCTFVETIAPSHVHPHPMHSIFSVSWLGRSALTVVRSLYTNCTISLPRKWEMAKRILIETHDNGRIERLSERTKDLLRQKSSEQRQAEAE